MLGVFNYGQKDASDITLEIDLDSLGLVPELPWQEFVQTRDLWKVSEDQPDANLLFHDRKLRLKQLPSHGLQLIGIRKY